MLTMTQAEITQLRDDIFTQIRYSIVEKLPGYVYLSLADVMTVVGYDENTVIKSREKGADYLNHSEVIIRGKYRRYSFTLHVVSNP